MEEEALAFLMTLGAAWLIIALFIFVVYLFIYMLIMRWVFRINKIVGLLEKQEERLKWIEDYTRTMKEQKT